MIWNIIMVNLEENSPPGRFIFIIIQDGVTSFDSITRGGGG
jgi:hypothetical protein